MIDEFLGKLSHWNSAFVLLIIVRRRWRYWRRWRLWKSKISRILIGRQLNSNWIAEYVCTLMSHNDGMRWMSKKNNKKQTKARSRWRDRGIASRKRISEHMCARMRARVRPHARKRILPTKWIVRKFIACYITTNNITQHSTWLSPNTCVGCHV